MLALREAVAAYRDGWVRVWQAPRILVLLAGATILVTAAGLDGAPASRPFVLDVFEPLGTALMGGAIAAALDASDVTSRLGGESAPWLLWLLVVIGGVVLTGGVMDRYARQRPLDARTFWGVSGELAFRLIRLSAIGGALFAVLTGALVLVLDAIATAVLAAAGPERGEAMLWALELGLRVPYLAAAFALFAATDAGRVRMVVERRRSALFAFTAGARFAWRHRAPVVAPLRGVVRHRRDPLGAGLGRRAVAGAGHRPGAAPRRRPGRRRDHRGARQRRRRHRPVPGRPGARVLRRAAAPGLAGLPRHRDALRAEPRVTFLRPSETLSASVPAVSPAGLARRRDPQCSSRPPRPRRS